jgi:hypothetical protein
MLSSAENKIAKQRPVAVTVLAVLLAIYAAFLIVVFIILFANIEKVHSRLTPSNTEIFFVNVILVDPLRMILAATLSVGLWRLHIWARYGAALFAGWLLVDRILMATVFAPTVVPNALKSALSPSGIIRLVTLIVIAGYLFHPAVTNAFTNAKAPVAS